MSSPKTNCSLCRVEILQTTADVNEGRCMCCSDVTVLDADGGLGVLKLIGYWSQKKEDKYPNPATLAGFLWDEKEKARMIAYLRNGIEFRFFWGYAKCYLGNAHDEQMGSKELSDGVYAWTEGLVYYLENFSIRLPEAFVNHVRKMDYQIPENLEISVRSEQVSDEMWMNWAEEIRK